MTTDATVKGIVYSLRFNAKEVELLRDLAAREGMKIADVIREAIQHMASPLRNSSATTKTGWIGSVNLTWAMGAPPPSGTTYL